jgi:hypothetical protein
MIHRLDSGSTSPSPTEQGTDRLVDTCERLLAEHLEAVRLRFGPAGLGVIDLPDLGSEPMVSAQVKVGAVLYWCREVEETGLVEFVEALAEGLAQGTLSLPIGSSADRLYRAWRRRGERFSRSERRALHQRLFGDPSSSGDAFDAWMRGLIVAVVELGRRRRDRGVADVQARIAMLATNIGRHLSERAVGIAAFAAREYIAAVRDALSLLEEPDLSGALGGGTPWMVLRRWGPNLLGRELEVSRHVARGESGLVILQWIASGATSLHQAAYSLPRRGALIAAAERWIATEGM